MVSFPFHLPQLIAPSSLTSRMTLPRQTRMYSLLNFFFFTITTSPSIHELVQDISPLKGSLQTLPNSATPPHSPTVLTILELQLCLLISFFWAPDTWNLEHLQWLVPWSSISEGRDCRSAECPQETPWRHSSPHEWLELTPENTALFLVTENSWV